MKPEPILKAMNIHKSYRQGTRELEILKGINFQVSEAETVSLMGQSGSGKSTLIAILAGLDHPTSGELWVAGQDLSRLSSSQSSHFRARHIGVIFQQFHLLPHLTALENVRLPLDFLGSPEPTGASTKNSEGSATAKAYQVLERLNLAARADHFPNELSRGECQRVAIGRVLVMKPPVVFADEPTGSLDLRTAEEIMDLIFEVIRRDNLALIMATHDPQIAARCQTQYILKSGQLQYRDKTQHLLVTPDDL